MRLFYKLNIDGTFMKYISVLLVFALFFSFCSCKEEDDFVPLKGKRLKELKWLNGVDKSQKTYSFEYDDKGRACKIISRYQDDFSSQVITTRTYTWYKNFIEERTYTEIDTLFLKDKYVNFITDGHSFGKREYLNKYTYGNGRLNSVIREYVFNSLSSSDTITFKDFNQAKSTEYCTGYNPAFILDKVHSLDYLSLAHPNLFGLESNVLAQYLKESERYITYELDEEGYIIEWEDWVVFRGSPYLSHVYLTWE